MTKNKITNLEITSITFFITRAFLVGVTFNSLLKSMKQNSWMTPLFSIPFGIIYIFFVIYIINYKPNLDINNKLSNLFSKPLTFIIISIITIILLLACTLNFLNLCNFIQSQFLIRTPIYIIAILFSLTTFYVVSKGINTITRTSNILFYISIFFITITTISLVSNIKISNIEPFLNLKPINYMKGLNTFYAFHICPIFLLTLIKKDSINNPKLKKITILSFILSIITITLTMLITISAFGYKLALLYEYPIFHILKHLSITGFSSRIESILVIQLIFDFFVCHILLVYFISSNIKYLTNTKNNNIWYIITSLTIIIGTLFFSRYSIYLDKYLKLIIPLITTILATIIIIIICIKIKMSKNSF